MASGFSRNFVVTFNATAPKKESFPFDESERVYVGYLNVNRNPLVIPVQVIAQNGSFLMLFPATEGGLYFMPLPRSASAQIALQGQGNLTRVRVLLLVIPSMKLKVYLTK